MVLCVYEFFDYAPETEVYFVDTDKINDESAKNVMIEGKGKDLSEDFHEHLEGAIVQPPCMVEAIRYLCLDGHYVFDPDSPEGYS